MRASRWVMAFLLLLAVGLAREAIAEKRVALLEIEGSRTPRLRNQIKQLLKGHEVFSAQAYRNAAKRLRSVKLTPNHVMKVARFLEVDAIIDGTLVAEESGYKLTIRVRNGTDGLISKRITMRLAQPGLSSTIRSGLAQRLDDALAKIPVLESEASPVDEGFVEEDAEPAEPRARKKEKQKTPPKPTRRRVKPEPAAEDEKDVESEEFVEEKDEGATETSEEPEAEESALPDDDGTEEESVSPDADDASEEEIADATPFDPRRSGVVAVVGLSFNKRRLRFESGLDPEDRPAGYQGSFVPGLTIAADIYPMLLLGQRSSVLAGLAGTFFVDQVFSLTSNVPGDAGMEVGLPTSQRRWSLGLSFRHNFGGRDSSPTVLLRAAYNQQRFRLDRAAAPAGLIVDVPNVGYRYLDPGAQFRFGILSNAVAYLDLRYIFMMSAGEITGPEQYGNASITGIDGDVGLEFRFAARYLVRAGFRYSRVGYVFDGDGALSSNRDGDVSDVDVSGAADTYMGGYLSGGFLY